jgi:DNA uptake protein ComE-like DNA-binding protein
MKKKILAFLQFTRGERQALAVCLMLILLLYTLPRLLPDPPLPNIVPGQADTLAIMPQLPVRTLFPFDPNTLDSAGWLALGLPPRTIHNLLRYRSKGGRFRTAAAIGKIWGMDSALVRQLIPFVRIAAAAPQERYPARIIPVIDINTASQSDWEALPGIGPASAARILSQRERFQGFARWEELQSIYGIADTVWTKLKPYLRLVPGTIPRQNLNHASAAVIERKTGISSLVAKGIVAFRQQEGRIYAYEDLLRVPGMSPEWLLHLQAVFILE